MKWTALGRKLLRGLPYLSKECRAIISDHTPFFIGKPRVVHIWRGAPCNGHCIMCDIGFASAAARKALAHSEFTDEMLSDALPQIARLCGRGTMVSYMGGEPTVNRHLVDWVRTASRLGLDFRFTTNGYRVTPELARELVAAGLFNIGVSLESLDPRINEIMRPYPDGTALTLQAIESLLNERRRQRARLSINIKTVISNVNADSFVNLARRWGKEDGVMVTPQAFEAMEGMPEPTRELLFIRNFEKVRQLVENIRQLKREGYNIHISEEGLDGFLKLYCEDRGHQATMHHSMLRKDSRAPKCQIATDNLWIMDGAVRICPYFPPVGNLLVGDVALREIWNSRECRQARQQTRACRRLCNIACLRRTPLLEKVRTFLRIA